MVTRPALHLAALLAALALAAPAAAAPRRVPLGWVGNTVSGPFFDRPALAPEFGLMVTAGVESVRLPVFWSSGQPYARASDVPPDQRARFVDVEGVPTDFTVTDRLVGEAARRRLQVLPVVSATPTWASVDPGNQASPPRRTADYARYLRTLVGRYGPKGTFWREHRDIPRLPVREWQIWNEPGISVNWSVQPFARGYVALLRASYQALKRADRSATVVLAGSANSSWIDLRKIYRAGGRRWFDVAAVHPYTSLVKNVVRIVELNRAAMSRFGDARKAILITELTWGSATGQVPDGKGFRPVTEAGQARLIASAFPALARVRRRYRIGRVYWFTWIDPPRGSPNLFDYAGLRRLEGSGTVVSKPSLGAYRRAARALEGCAKRTRADRCG